MSTGYGYGMSATTRLFTGRRSSGTRLLKEAIYRRITTPRGTVADAPDYGIDIGAYVGAIGGDAVVAALPAIIEAEVLKDDRVASSECTVTREAAGAGLETFEATLHVSPSDETTSFDLTIGIDSLGVTTLRGSL